MGSFLNPDPQPQSEAPTVRSAKSQPQFRLASFFQLQLKNRQEFVRRKVLGTVPLGSFRKNRDPAYFVSQIPTKGGSMASFFPMPAPKLRRRQFVRQSCSAAVRLTSFHNYNSRPQRVRSAKKPTGHPGSLRSFTSGVQRPSLPPCLRISGPLRESLWPDVYAKRAGSMALQVFRRLTMGDTNPQRIANGSPDGEWETKRI